MRFCILSCVFTYLLLGVSTLGFANQTTLLNASYDPTRELYHDYNALFAQHWLQLTGQHVAIETSHGGSAEQARAVMDGVDADVVTLALAYDIDVIAKKTRLIRSDWQTRLPYNSAPYTSTVVFLVRKGNPKNIRDWPDLLRTGMQVIMPNPKTSGGARWSYLAALGYARYIFKSDPKRVMRFMHALLHNVPVLDAGSRGATTTFVQRGIGDVLLTWENEALLAQEKLGKGRFDIVMPKMSILAEPSVAVVDKNAKAHGTYALAQAYLQYMYSPQAQRIIAKYYYRPHIMDAVDPVDRQRFKPVRLMTLKSTFGSWQAVQAEQFSDGGVFDQIMADQ